MKAEFEWVCTVGVGVGMRTAIAQTVGVGRQYLRAQHEQPVEAMMPIGFTL